MKLRHEKAAEYWRLNGRDNTLTAQQFDVAPLTIARWRDGEDWVRKADERDRRDAEELAALSLEAAARHTQETDALLAETRALLRDILVDVRARQAMGASIEESEKRTIGQLLDICVSAGAKKYGAAAIKHEVTKTDPELEDKIKAQLIQAGFNPDLYGESARA